MQRIFGLPPVPPGTDFDELGYIRAGLDCYDPDCHTCQGCGKKLHAGCRKVYYKRCITYVHGGRPMDETILIPCVFCAGCTIREKVGEGEEENGKEKPPAKGGYFHAVLFGTLVPFSSYTLLFILTVLHCYFHRTTTVRGVCEQWGISPKTLYQWKGRYLDHYRAWLDASLLREGPGDPPEAPPDGHVRALPGSPAHMASKAPVYQSLEVFLSSILPMLRGFFHTSGFSFLQPNRKTHRFFLSGCPGHGSPSPA